ncbi:MAG: protein-L-isoaspartate O-methyltransferase [Gammaproteobacteria bacterium]
MNLEQAREFMIERQVRTWEVLNPVVLEVLRSIPREDFVPGRFKNLAFADIFIPLGHGEVMMTPKLEGRVLQALDIGAQDRVLEIGCGSGFLAACLGAMANRVLSVDLRADFIKTAQQNIETAGLGNVELAVQDSALLNWTDEQFDVIVISGSMPALDESFTGHLKTGGRLFAVIGDGPMQEAMLMTRMSTSSLTSESLFDTDLPPLRNISGRVAFQF